ncbi:hypothetical protein LEQ03_08135 [Riemerella anatipestifer]|nr:hypothetical protein LEQ03_08135 [Riemerella anatipestifer]
MYPTLESKSFCCFICYKKVIFSNRIRFCIADPAHGIITLTQEKFEKSWLSDEDRGVVLFLSPTEEFYKKQPPKQEKISIGYLLHYLKPYRKQLSIIFLLLFFGSGLTLIFPFLTEVLIDKGVNAKDLEFIFVILLAQLGVFLGAITIEIFRNWLMLYIGTHLSINIISDFLKKCFNYPSSFLIPK